MSKPNVAAAHGGSQRHSRYQPKAHPLTRRHVYRTPVIDARLFYDPADGRKWKRRCEQKRTVWIAFLDISHGGTKTCAVEKQIGRLKGIPPRTVRWIIRLLRTQGFLRDVRKHGLRDALERELLPDRLGKHPSPDSESCRTSTAESCRVKAVRELHSEKPKQDSQDTPRQKTTAAGAVRETSDLNSPLGDTFKPFRTPRQVFETACRLVGRHIAVWTFYRALKYGREHGLTLDKCVPFSTSYYVRSYFNFCRQFEQQQQDAIFEVVEDRLHDEQLQWPPTAWYALDEIPRRGDQQQTQSQQQRGATSLRGTARALRQRGRRQWSS
jgi:hypothetical protein